MSGKKYTGPLPKSKPTDLERWQGFRSTNKPTNAEEQERIGNKMAKKFKKSPKAQRYEEGGNVISDADAKRLRKTLPYVPGKTISDADAKRLRKTLPYVPGKSTSDADLEKLKKLMKPLKYEDGGAVRGMGAAYQGKSRTCKVR